jgi:alpha-amylase
MAHDLAANGVTDILFPSPRKTNAGAFKGADGYGTYDPYDLGTKNTSQFGGVPTRFGTGEQLRRAIAICRANGMTVHLDIVDHQRMGGRNGVYRYLGADGKTQNGRFPLDPGCFSPSRDGETIPPFVHVDPVPSPKDNFPFGNPLAPVNAVPKGYVWDGLIAAGDWLFRTTGAGGGRLDDSKGTNIEFIKAYMTSGAMRDKFFFGEYASGNPDDLNWWIGQVEGRASALDFGFHYNRAQPMCNDAGGGNFTMKSLRNRHNALLGTNPMKAVPYVESMDSDTNGFATIIFNKILGYALLLASEGLPMIYIRDYLKEEDCYGLKPYIDNLMWCARCLGNGATIDRYADDKVFAFERTGAPGLLCTLNNDVWSPEWKRITVQTNFGHNVRLQDYSGHCANDEWTDDSGRVTLPIPPGANGLGYGMWSRSGLSQTMHVPIYSCTQEFFGAADLSPETPEAQNGRQTAGRIYCAADTPIHATLDVEKVDWAAVTTIRYSVVGPDGAEACWAFVRHNTDPEAHGRITHTGWHTLVLDSTGLPEPAGANFTFKVTYTAPQTLSEEDF